jgi:hypothetical protein
MNDETFYLKKNFDCLKEKTCLSQSAFWSSKSTSTKSNLLRRGLASAVFTLILCSGLYFPFGFVAAMTVVLV